MPNFGIKDKSTRTIREQHEKKDENENHLSAS